MSGSQRGHGKAQKLLLISKILDNRDQASPFTLIIDSLEQPATPLLGEYIRRAQVTRAETIFVSFSTLKPPAGADHFIRANSLVPSALQQRIRAIVGAQKARFLIVLDNLYQVASDVSTNLAAYLSALILPSTSLVAVYHSDQALPWAVGSRMPYSPTILTVLRHLATTIFFTRSFSHELARKSARDRSLAEPSFGLREEQGEGVIQSLGSADLRGCVLEVEHRRKSGRAVGALIFLSAASATKRDTIVLLEDHPLFMPPQQEPGHEDQEALGEVSFNLGLTDKQRKDRDAVVLPYFDAQREVGAASEGGRILYDMGSEDDFDEEEDEI